MNRQLVRSYTGTPKQMLWATSIYNELQGVINDIHIDAVRRVKVLRVLPSDYIIAIEAAITIVIRALGKVSKASDIIDRRKTVFSVYNVRKSIDKVCKEKCEHLNIHVINSTTEYSKEISKWWPGKAATERRTKLRA